MQHESAIKEIESLGDRRSLDRTLRSPNKTRDRLRLAAGRREMVGNQFRLGLGQFRKMTGYDIGNPAVQYLSVAAKQALIRGILYQSVLEDVRRLWRNSPTEDQLGRGKLRQRRGEIVL